MGESVFLVPGDGKVGVAFNKTFIIAHFSLSIKIYKHKKYLES